MSTDEPEQPSAGDARASVLIDVSNAMVRLFDEQFGRRPTTARAYWSGPDALTCFLEETLTPAERNLAKLGEHQRLRDTRMLFLYATVSEFVEPVEQITGRTVRSFQSAIDTEAEGLAVETFIFYPEGKEGRSRAALADV